MPRVYLRGELSKASRAPGMMSHSQLVPSHAYECFACNSVYYVHGWGLHRPEGGIRSSGAGVTDSCEPPRPEEGPAPDTLQNVLRKAWNRL
ncbi:hypothetical protein LEMLEM_LOCUS10448, partial [Lemmus lemmus]